MSSPFTMLGMLSKARRASAKRREATRADSTSSTPATSTAPLPSINATIAPSSTPAGKTTAPAPSTLAATESDLDLSDSASIISVSSLAGTKPKKKRTPSMLLRGLSLSRKPSTGSVISQTQTQPQSGASTANILSPILASPIDTEVPGHGFTREPESLDGQSRMGGPGFGRKASSDGFSVVSHHEEEEQATSYPSLKGAEKVNRDEGDWTDVVEAFPSPPPLLSTPSSDDAPTKTVSTTGLGLESEDVEPNSLSFNDAEELTSADEELKKAVVQVKALESSLADHEAERARLQAQIRNALAEKERLGSMVQGVEARLTEVENRSKDEQKEKERLGKELLRVREENSGLSKSLQDQVERLKALEDRYAQQETAKSQLQADLARVIEDRDKLAIKAKADADALKETKARYARQELEKGGVKAELQSISREKETATLRLYSVTQNLEDSRRDYEEECAKVKTLEAEEQRLQGEVRRWEMEAKRSEEEKRRLAEEKRRVEKEKRRVEGEVERLQALLAERTSEKEESAVEAKEAGEELDHLYKRYAEQDDELNRLKEELHKVNSHNSDLSRAAQDARTEIGIIQGKMADMEKAWTDERSRLVAGHLSETTRMKGDLQASTAIAEELLRAAREAKRESTNLTEKVAEMSTKWDQERRRMVQEHSESTRSLMERERQKAAEERRTLVAEYERKLDQLMKAEAEEAQRRMSEMEMTRTHLAEEHAAKIQLLKEEYEGARLEWKAERETLAEGYAVAQKQWDEEKKAMRAKWVATWSKLNGEYRALEETRDTMRTTLLHERNSHAKELQSAKEKLDALSAEDLKKDEELERKETRILELENELKRMPQLERDLATWKSKAGTEAAEADRLRSIVQKLSSTTDNGLDHRVFEDQAKRQSTQNDIQFNRPSTSRPRLGARESVEPLDAAVSVLYALNSEIFQAAASLADTVEGEMHRAMQTASGPDFAALVEKVAPFISEELVISLRSAYAESPDSTNPLVLQVAFQACLAYCCNRFITSWYPLHWEYGRFLEVLHGRIVDAGAVSDADTWRSTTRALLRPTSESHSEMVAYLRDSVLDVLIIIGDSNPDAILSQFEEKFSVIARLAIRMHILFGDAPSSLSTFLVQPRARFDERVMDDTYADDVDEPLHFTDSTVKNVICTSEIGLQRVGVSGVRNGAEQSIIVKPKVILAAILNQEW